MWSSQENTSTEEPKGKLAIWEQFLGAFKGVRNYPILISQKKTSKVQYFFFLLLVICIFTVFVPVTGYLIGVGGIGNYIEEKIPEFTLSGGQLQMEGTVAYESATMKLYGDTTIERYTKSDVDENAYVQILISRTNVLVYSGGYVMDYPLEQYGAITFSKSNLQDMVPLIYCMILFYVVVLICSQAVNLLLTILMFVLVGQISNYLYHYGLSFGQMFALALYAVTISFTLESINTSLQLMSGTVVSMIGMIWAAVYYFMALNLCGRKNSYIKS